MYHGSLNLTTNVSRKIVVKIAGVCKENIIQLKENVPFNYNWNKFMHFLRKYNFSGHRFSFKIVNDDT